MCKLSIIIPFYNVEKFFDKCLYSVLNQTFKDFEVILVDDASPDNSKAIAEKYVKLDKRFHLYTNNKNRWQCFCRNWGIRLAKGEYIAFVDADDWLDFDMYEKLYQLAKETDADIVKCNIKEHHKKKIRKASDIHCFQNIKDDINKNIILALGAHRYMCWNGIYKREFLRKNAINNPLKTKYEDISFTYQCFVQAKKIVYVDEYLYNYNLENENSDSQNMKILYPNYFKNMRFVKRFLRRKNKFEEYQFSMLLSCFYLYTWACVNRSFLEKKYILREFRKIMKDIPKDDFKTYIKKCDFINKKDFHIFVNGLSYKFLIYLLRRCFHLMNICR
jgi:glycosyltransferase involved in cell wall biosynthesis